VQTANEDYKYDIIPKTSEKFSSIIVNKTLRFVDSLAFLNGSLGKLVEVLGGDNKDDFKLTKKVFEGKGNTDLLFKKGIYPYNHMKGVANFKETCLPEPEAFRSDLTGEMPSVEEREKADEVWRSFHIKDMGEWHDLYVLLDVTLLADVTQRMRNMIWNDFHLEMGHYFSLPMLSYDALLKMSEEVLEIPDLDKYIWLETGLRGGVCGVGSLKTAKANNPYMGQLYNKDEEISYISMFDVVSFFF
jgi:hypothetical protein